MFISRLLSNRSTAPKLKISPLVEGRRKLDMIQNHILKQLRSIEEFDNATEANLRHLYSNQYLLFIITDNKKAYKTYISFDIKMDKHGNDIVTFHQTAEELVKSLTFHRNVTR